MSIELEFTKVDYNKHGTIEWIESLEPMTISEWKSKFPELRGLEINKNTGISRTKGRGEL